jgi:hypothetical protein
MFGYIDIDAKSYRLHELLLSFHTATVSSAVMIAGDVSSSDYYDL